MSRGDQSSGSDIAQGLDALLPVVRGIAIDLLLYKTLFWSPIFESLSAQEAEPEVANVLQSISRETRAEVLATIQTLNAWGARVGPLDEVRARLRSRVLDDLLHLKESTTEAFLLVGMRAPTNDLRRAFVELADLDRKHADDIRGLLGMRGIERRLTALPWAAGAAVGAHDSRAIEGSLARSLELAIEKLRADGQEPSTIVLSAVALRHVRDEGLLGPLDGTACGLPVEVDFGWRGECYAIRTADHANLAELISARAASEPA